MSKKGFREGFTLIELSLSLVFISTLSLTVVLVIAGAISSYHKSITLNQVNTVGTNVVDDMRHSVQESSSRKLEYMCDQIYKEGNANCTNDGGAKFASITKRSTVKIKSNNKEIGNNVPVFGAFCTGTYSYIWNSGYYFNKEYIVGNGTLSRASLRYIDNGNIKTIKDFKLLKVEDEDRAVCIAAVRVQGNNTVGSSYTDANMGSEFNLTLKGLVNPEEQVYIKDEPVEILSGGEEGMALYDLNTTVSEQTGVQKNMYYYTSFILGTIQGGINISANGEACEVPEAYDKIVENFDYCAINKFNFAAMANGG